MSLKNEDQIYVDFVHKMIRTLRDHPYKGIHTKFKNVLPVLRKKFPDDDPVEIIDYLVDMAHIFRRPVKGGYMIYIFGEEPKTARANQHSQEEIDNIIEEIENNDTDTPPELKHN